MPSTSGGTSHRCHSSQNYDNYDTERINNSGCLANCAECAGHAGCPGAGASLQGTTAGDFCRILTEGCFRCPIRQGNGTEGPDRGWVAATVPASQTPGGF